jgi:hypothetical protein
MTGASIVADFRKAIELLAELDEPTATRTAEVLTRWLAAEDFDSAAGLVPGWRSHLRLTARDRALASLAKMHSDMDDSAIARLIVEGFPRAGANSVRADGGDGYIGDLARAGCDLSARQWRRVIAEVRGHQSR